MIDPAQPARTRLALQDHIKARVDLPLRVRPAVGAAPPFRVYVIYRQKNAGNVARLAAQTPPGHLHAWALDEVAPECAAATLGAGPGLKFDLLRELLRLAPPAPDEYCVVADDDVHLVRGSLSRFLALADAANFDIAQPGHDRRGFPNYGLTVSRPLSRARLTTFVEIGPLFAVAPSRREDLLGLPDDLGMGFGIEQYWYNLEPHVRFGVVDEVRVRHLVPAGTAYDADGLARDMPALFRRLNATRSQPQLTLGTWPAWRRTRAWATPARTATPRSGGPGISVCIPTYNGARWLPECIASVTAQDVDLEIVVSDDASTDGRTLDLLRSWASDDDRVRLVENSVNSGLVGNWNTCLSLARGEWLKFVFQDDFLAPGALSAFQDAVSDRPAGDGHGGGSRLVFARRAFRFEDVPADDRRGLEEYVSATSPETLGIPVELSPADVARLSFEHPAMNFVGEPTSVMFHRSALRECGAFNPDLVQVCDLEYWIRAGALAGMRRIDDELSTFRVHGGAATTANFSDRAFHAASLDPLVLRWELLFGSRHAHTRAALGDPALVRRERLRLRQEAFGMQARLLKGTAARRPESRQRLSQWSDVVAGRPALRPLVPGPATRLLGSSKS
jgi:glycosyltransferase involved in cell wall biosynthesis